MTMDRLTRTVREQIALGRLLPLGTADDAAWITERAAVDVLRRAADALPGVRLGEVSLAPASPADPAGPAGYDLEVLPAGVTAAAPVGALPHVPLRVEASFEAAADEPLPFTAERLRRTLWDAAEVLVGLTVDSVDLEVTGLLEDGAAPAALASARAVTAADPAPDNGAEGFAGVPGLDSAGGAKRAVEAAALSVPGVARLTNTLVSLRYSVRVRDTSPPQDAPGRRVQVQIAVAPGHRPLNVARAVSAAARAAAGPTAPGPVTTAVLVTSAG